MKIIYHSNLTVGYSSASLLMTTQGIKEDCLIAIVGLTVLKVNTEYRIEGISRRKTEHQLAVL